MKKIVITIAIIFALSAGAFQSEAQAQRMGGGITFQTFYNDLSPYGDWIYTHDYGYVWRPWFDRYDYFQPYATDGYWENTPYGWMWISDYKWGWATFHYGRWFYDDYLGWMWIPGYEWAPAWVTWGTYRNCYGWAPMGPNVSITVSWRAPSSWWTFVPKRHFYSYNWNNYIYDRRVVVNRITVINNVYVYNNGYDDGYVYGYDRGYRRGYNKAITEVTTVGMTMATTVDTKKDMTMAGTTVHALAM